MYRMKVAATIQRKTVKQPLFDLAEAHLQELERKGMLPKGSERKFADSCTVRHVATDLLCRHMHSLCTSYTTISVGFTKAYAGLPRWRRA